MKYSMLTLVIGFTSTFAITPNAYAVDVDEFRQRITDKTVHMYHKKKDKEYRRYFAKDGVVIEDYEEDGYRKGSWNITYEKLCIAWPGSSAKCRKIMGDDDEYGTANKKGKKMVVVFQKYEDGNQIAAPEGMEQDIASTTIHEELVTIDTREGITQTFLLIEPKAKPKGVVVLYPGHEGVIRFNKVGNQYSGENEGGGLTAHEASRQSLSQAGYAVAVLAPPSDQEIGMDTDFRFSDEHAYDAKKVIAYLRNKYNQDVYLSGHCRSTFSPAAIATKLNNAGIAGIILSSTRSEGNRGSVMDLPKGKVKVPMLLVQHVDDPCDGTPYKNLSKLKEFYQASSPDVNTITVSGGDGSRRANAPGCSGGYHAFKGLKRPVMDAIVKWLNKEEYPKSISE